MGVTEYTDESAGPRPGGSRERAVRWGPQSTQLSQLGHGQVDQGRGLVGQREGVVHCVCSGGSGVLEVLKRRMG